jgi:hypothetical protein
MGHPFMAVRRKLDAGKDPSKSSMPEFKAGDWSRDEQQTISSESYAIFGRDPSKGRMFAIREAVKLLPKPRRRFVTKWYHVRNFIERDWAVLDQSTGRNYAEANVEHEPLTDLPAPTNDAALTVEPQAAPSVEEAPAKPKAKVKKDPVEPAEAAPVETEEAPAPVAAAAAAAAAEASERKRKVYWKPDVVEKVALTAAELLLKNPDLKPIPLTNAAQEIALPPEQHRRMVTIDQCKGVPERAAELVPIIKRRIEKQAQEEQEAREAAERIERERIEREERERAETEERVRAEAQVEAARLLAEQEEARRRIHAEAFNSAVAQEVQKRLDAAPYTAILGALAKKVVGDFMGELTKEMRATMETQLYSLMDQFTKPAAAPAAPEPEQQKPRHLNVVVVGLGNQEYDQLRKDFFGDVTFKQVKVLADSRHGQTAQAMLEAARGMDAVFAMHHVVGADVKMAALKLKEMKVPYVAVTGNIRDLKSRLKSALTGELPFELAAA